MSPLPTPDPTGPGQESVWSFPKKPRIEPVTHELRVFLAGNCIAHTRRGFRVLQTAHPPVYFFPEADVDPDALKASDLAPTLCEYKGVAIYLNVYQRNQTREVSAPAAAFVYPYPTPDFSTIAGCISYYAGAMDSCTVNGVPVVPQPGGFYGGWITPDLTGPFKGLSGTDHW